MNSLSKIFVPDSSIMISEWSGRLGNNLMQLSNALYISRKYGCRLDYPDHPLLDRKTFQFGQIKSSYVYISRFYDRTDCQGIYPGIKERQEILQEDVRNILKLNLFPDHKAPDHDLVIQMRSGDMFNQPPPPKYVPSPLSFFQKIIDENPFEKILIICENDRNPCIEKLAGLYPNCFIQSSSLESDIRTIVNAKNLCITVGTFGFILALLSTELRNLYVDDIPREILDFGFFDSQNQSFPFRVHRYRIRNYIRSGEWKNKSDQRRLMFDLPKSDVEYIFS